jgi:hypothetical protein
LIRIRMLCRFFCRGGLFVSFYFLFIVVYCVTSLCFCL